jgi:hypothetical protein
MSFAMASLPKALPLRTTRYHYHFSANPIGVQVACQGGYDNHAQMSAFGIEALRFSLELL